MYNWGLQLKTENYAKGIKISCFDTINKLKELKKEYEWLKEVHSQPLQMALRNLDNAYTKFFKKTGKFPRFKSKHCRQSFQYPQGVKIDFSAGVVFLPKIGKVGCVFHRQFKGKVKTTTVSKNGDGKYFVSILVETEDLAANKIQLNSKNQAIGIDLGIKSFAVTSNGLEIFNPKHLKSREKRLVVKQRQLSRKAKGSNNRARAKIEVAKVHSQISNARKDFHHKISKAVIDKYDVVCLEDLNVKGMIKNRKLAKAISDCGWSQFNSFLEYKAEWQGKTVVRLNRFQATSQPCVSCSKLNPLVKNLAIREWVCDNCGFNNHRDYTASQNIKRFGLIQLGFEEPEPRINKSL